MADYSTTYFEVIREDVVDNTKTASAAIVAGKGVMISGNGTVATVATTETLLYGIAMEAAAIGQAVPILIKGVVSILADSTTATLVISGEGANMTYGTLVYVTNVGKWRSDNTNAALVGRVIDVQVSTTSYERVEVAINVGAYFTPTE